MFLLYYSAFPKVRGINNPENPRTRESWDLGIMDSVHLMDSLYINSAHEKSWEL